MTTIAYKDGILAADSQATMNGDVACWIRKIDSVNGILFGACGATIIAQEFMDWVRTGMRPDEVPAMGVKDGDNEAHATGLLIGGGYIVEFTKWGILTMVDQPYAIGSGGISAKAAMAAGCTAAEAVSVASEIDIYTGGPIVTVGRT